jgi:hypothetical protein
MKRQWETVAPWGFMKNGGLSCCEQDVLFCCGDLYVVFLERL